ncbi:MAG TPA: cytochrome c biogenesis protein CcsA [Longimicrobiales bacterium]|nr:cytochrome c biogenesis protein CcsA [Longimicrobiales bacterium]
MSTSELRRLGTALTVVGLLGLALVYGLSFFWVSTEAVQGVAQRIFYVHVPAAWTSFLGFAIAALASAMYLWLRDERFDRTALCAAEGGIVFATIMITTGPLWGKIAWGTYWTREPRLTLTLLMWFIFLGYFLVRRSSDSPEKGKRYAAVTAIVGALLIPFIHVSVLWFRSLHPQPVVLRTDGGPALPGDMLALLLTSLAVFTTIFAGLFMLRYALEGLRDQVDRRVPEAVA